MYLRRGQPSNARDPMDIPPDVPIDEQREISDDIAARRRLNAIHHLAMAYRRLMAANSVQEAEDLHAIFCNRFGAEYEEEVARVIQEEEDDTSDNASPSEGRTLGDWNPYI
jgi:hypothetical protein